MDPDKLKQWLEMAQKFQGGNFWQSMFNTDYVKQFMNDPMFQPDGTGTEKSNMQQFWDQSGPVQTSARTSSEYPLVDIYMTPANMIVLAELPGISKNNLQLTLAGDQLTIKGFIESHYDNTTKIQSERYHGDFERTIRLPEAADTNKMNAKYGNGVLVIKLPRMENEEQNITID
ncbi:Hsp20/alpha crystallin family protein [Longirhabdus pacifica]|uniref:Hsp20/alpha crystallin family protein n=1 Tax=Longirhabdus pacifica TaxID=2305227 RepID=UPI0010091605|nr:Hsp20/alpha crystallin family protein [Longirhabdus pacifica]